MVPNKILIFIFFFFLIFFYSLVLFLFHSSFFYIISLRFLHFISFCFKSKTTSQGYRKETIKNRIFVSKLDSILSLTNQKNAWLLKSKCKPEKKSIIFYSFFFLLFTTFTLIRCILKAALWLNKFLFWHFDYIRTHTFSNLSRESTVFNQKDTKIVKKFILYRSYTSFYLLINF
jgi:hypothetical protein